MNKQPKTTCKNELKRRLRAGEFLVGTGVQLPDVSAAEIIALAGFDFVVVDTEHGPASYETALNQIIAIRAGGASSMARIPWNEPYLAKRVLETGPDAIMFPMINTPDEAKRAMDACVYPPFGKRGIGPMRAYEYGLSDMNEYVANSVESLGRFIQIETETAVKNIDAILKVPYIDGVIIGPADMSFSIEKPMQIRCPENLSLIDATVSACKRASIPIGIWMGETTEQGCRFWIDRGIDFLICQNDFALLAAAEKALCQAMRAAAKKTQKHMLKSKILGMSAFTFFLSLATVAALTTASVFVKPLWYKALPCFVTVAVLYLSANANKYSYLLGAANSVLYTVVYVVNGLYGGAVSGFLQGVMLQAAIFVKWSLSPGVKKKPVIKFLGKRNEAVVWAAMLGLWAAAYFVLRTLNGSNALLDALGFSLGIASFFMTIRAYAETWHIGMASYALQVVLWSVRIAADIRELPLLIISVYGLIKSVEGLLSWRKIRREQQSITASVHVPDTADERANE